MRNGKKPVISTVILAALSLLLIATRAVADQGYQGPLKVFILAGQSNMEGHGKIASDPDRNDGPAQNSSDRIFKQLLITDQRSQSQSDDG